MADPLLVVTDNTPRVSDGFATSREVEDAITLLSPAEIRKLVHAARVFGGCRRSKKCDWEELLQDAFTSTLAGARGLEQEQVKSRDVAKLGERRWKTNVPFVTFLIGVMKSLCSSEYRRSERRGGVSSSLDDVMVPARADGLEGRFRFDEIVALFWNDSDAVKVLEGLRFGMTGNEIQREILGTEPNAPKYNSVIRRIKRTLLRTEGI